MQQRTLSRQHIQINFLQAVILLPFWGYSLCLLNLGINHNKILRFGKNLQNWKNTGLFWIGKQLVFGCKIGKIKSLAGALKFNPC